MIKSKKSLGIKKVVDLELDSKSHTYVNKDGVVSHNCSPCRKHYGHGGKAPKLYRLSTLLANGSNYGKKEQLREPVVGSPHPNSRTSQIIELKPGFAVNPGGSVTYIGLDKWNDYLKKNVIK